MPTAQISSGRPLINEAYTPSIYNQATTKRISAKSLVNAIKGTPECIGIIKAITNDVFTKFTFRAVKDKSKSKGRPAFNKDREKEEEAIEFANKNFLKQELMAAGFDWLGTGDAYLWKGKISKSEIKEMVMTAYKESPYKFDEFRFKAENYMDEDYSGISSVQYVPASTMIVNYDKTRVTGYKQRTFDGSERMWKPDEILHALYMKWDGKVYGFSPMDAGYNVVKTLGYIKDYAGNWFDSGGTPDFIFWFEEEMAGSPAYNLAVQVLEDYKRNRRRGNLLLTGKLGVEKINEWNKDMEFRKLAIYYTGVLAFAFNMPLSKLQSILGGDVKGSAGGADTEDSGYWRNVEEAQVYWENLLNTQLFNPNFGVNIFFERKFPQDKVRKIQALTQAAALAESLLNREYPVSDEYIMDYLMEIPPEYREEGTIKRGSLIQDMPLKGNKNEKPKSEMDGVAKNKMKSDKQKQAIGS